ncbi:MAG: hypothetical protein F6K11_22010 [Leptolyngbya sp. SIO3F4]|nr:hypothetical protein [Leptolyngbya sp. SIO3F4]
MSLSNYIFALGIGLGMVIFGNSCQASSSNGVPVLPLTWSAVTIESLRQPGKVEKSLPLSGSVIQRLGVLNGALYQLDDGTGQVWVVTHQSAPALGEQIYLEGVVRYEPIVINGVDLGDYYLEEKQRELQTPNL